MTPCRFFAVLMLLAPLPGHVLAKDKVAPPPPHEATPPAPLAVSEYLRTYGDGRTFKAPTHEGIYTSWSKLQKQYLEILRRQVLNQDVWHQMQSSAHFDNCDFDGSMRYIRELMANVELAANRATASQAKNDSKSSEKDIKEAYRQIGRLLHGVQDFYAHTNYVEMLVQQVDSGQLNASDLTYKTVALWEAGGERTLEDLQESGLVSGVVWWGFPQRCQPGTPTHGTMAKDGNAGRGAQRVQALDNQTLHELALALAVRASLRFIEYAWETWPVLQLGKPRDAFPLDVLVDRRKLD